MTDTDRRKLKRYFQGKGGVLIAYLFGSSAKGEAGIKSDLDIAVLFSDKELQEGWLKPKIQIQTELYELLGRRDIDVVVLNGVASLLKHEVIKNGVILFEKDLDTRCDFEVQSEIEYLDFKPVQDLLTRSLIERIKEGKFVG